jgi:hypothetical protein
VKKLISESFSDSFSHDFLKEGAFSTPYASPKKNASASSDFLYPVDETPDFHDPYSALSLFLSHKIKREIPKGETAPKWSLKIQEELIRKIMPEFQKKFPQYRLGVSAVKKIWEKVLFYTGQIQGKVEAINPDGKLNINFFIKENLKQYLQHKVSSFLHPSQFAHQVAAKMSDCIATLEGTMPKLDLLTQTIWALQKHLLKNYSLTANKTPYDEFDKIDKLIVKTILETTAKHPYIPMEELEYKTKEALQALHDIPDFSSTGKITCNVSAILAERTYANSSIHLLFAGKQKEAIYEFITRHSSLYKNGLTAPRLPDLVRRLSALYTLASQLPKEIAPDLLDKAIQASFYGDTKKPELAQSVYAFISAELWLIRGMNLTSSLEEAKTAIFRAYQNASALPILQEENREFITIIIWKTLSETEGFLEKLPYRIGQKIEEEIANRLIEDPSKDFSSIVHETIHFFEKVKELTESKKWSESSKKIHIWCLQNDMLCRCIKLDLSTPLAQIIQNKYASAPKIPSHFSFVSEVCQEFLRKFPSMTPYIGQLNSKAWILYKHLWFTSFANPEESSFDRFLKWHILFLQNGEDTQEVILQKLEEICKSCLPLIPFDHKHASSIYFETKHAP